MLPQITQIARKQNLHAYGEIALSGVPLLCELSVCFVSFVVNFLSFLNHKAHEEERQHKGTRRTKPCPSFLGMELIGGPKESMVTNRISNKKKKHRVCCHRLRRLHGNKTYTPTAKLHRVVFIYFVNLVPALCPLWLNFLCINTEILEARGKHRENALF